MEELHCHPTCLSGTSCKRHTSRWQIWSNRSSSDRPRLGHLVLWKAICRRMTEMGEAWDAMFMLSWAISWVGKQAQLNANAVSMGEGEWLIAKAITEWHTKPRGPRWPCLIPPASPPFSFHNQDKSLQGVRIPTAAEWSEVPKHKPRALYHAWGQALQQGQDHGQRQWDLWATPPNHFHPHQIIGLSMTKVQCQLPHQCHLGPIDLEVPGI